MLTPLPKKTKQNENNRIASDGHDVNRVFYTGTCTDPVDAAAQCLSAGMDQDLGGMSYGPRCDVRNTTIYGCGAAVTEGGACPACPIDPYGAENAKSSILLTGIREGRVNMSDLDRAASNVLRAKFAARLFDGGRYRDPAMVNAFVNNEEHRALARSAATEGCILLKNVPPPAPPNTQSNCSAGVFNVGMDWEGDWNQSMVPSVENIGGCCDACAAASWCRHFSLTYSSMDCFLKGGDRTLVKTNGVTAGYCSKTPPPSPSPPSPPSPPAPLLPLNKAKLKRVAVLGPNGGGGDGGAAQQAQLGQYECTLDFGDTVTVEEGIRNVVSGTGIDVSYNVGADWSSSSSSPSLIDAAVAAANASDVAVIVLGDDTSTCGEGNDRNDIDLPGSQLDLLQAVTSKTSTPVVVVLINCRPATFGSGGPNSKYGVNPNSLLDGVGALLVAWNCGVEGGNAIADLLFGNASPSGRLASNWLSTVGSAGTTSATWGFARQQSDYDRTWRSSNGLDPVLYPLVSVE